jgi:hypothetical protein
LTTEDCYEIFHVTFLRRIEEMAEKKAVITPQPGEFWIRYNLYGGGGNAGTYRGFIYNDPQTGQLMFGEFHFEPWPVNPEMIHGNDGWHRDHPPVPKE